MVESKTQDLLIRLFILFKKCNPNITFYGIKSSLKSWQINLDKACLLRRLKTFDQKEFING